MAKTSSSLPAGGNLFHNTLMGLNDGDFQHLTMLEKANLEFITNKQDSLTIDGTGTKYPTVDAVNDAIISGATPDATSTIKGKLKLTNDLGGTADLPLINVKTLNSTPIKGSGDLIIDKTFVGLGNVDNTSDLNKPISTATQNALNLKENKSEKNQINGYAGLGIDGKIFSNQLPALAITDTFVVASQAAMLNLTLAETGDIAVRTDLNKTFILKGTTYSTLSDWQELITPTDSVQSVFGRTGTVIANPGDYDTSLVPDTSNKRYVTDANLVTIGNQSGINTGDNSVNTNSNAYADSKVEDLIVDGVINKAPSQNVVFDALDVKTGNSAGAVQGFAITNNGNGTVNIASGIAYLRATNDQYAPLLKYTIPAVTNLALTDNANNYILVDYNGGSPAITVTTNSATINTETNSLLALISRVGTTLDFLSLVGQNNDANAKIRQRFLNQEGIRRANGAIIGFSNRNLILTAGTLFSGLIRINSPAFNTVSPDTFTYVYNNGVVWTRIIGQTQVDNTQYNNSGVLTALGNNDFRTDYIYLLPNNPSKLYVVYGTTSYTNITLARNAPTPTSLPTELQVLGLLVGRQIIQKNAVIISEVSSAFADVFTNTGVPEHNALAGIQGGAVNDYQHLTTAEKALIHNPVTIGTANGLSLATQVLSLGLASTSTIGALSSIDWNTFNNKQPLLTNPVTGTGTTNFVSKWSSTGVQTDSRIIDTGTRISFGNTGGYGDYSFNKTAFGNNEIALATSDGVQNPRAFIRHLTASGSQSVEFASLFSTASALANWNFLTGNVGIGTNSPASKLNVIDTQIGLPSDTLILGNASGVAGSTSGIVFAPSAIQDGTRGAKISALQKGSNNIDLLFSTGNGVIPVERLRIFATGGVSIGNTTDLGAGTLNVTGNITTIAATTSNHVVIKSQLDALVPTGRKLYKALITQTSTGAPTVTILFNTIGAIVWTRSATGSYVGTLSTAFTANKTMCFINNTSAGFNVFQQATANTVTLVTQDITGTNLDGKITNASITIEVYP